jgi:tetratricopeptide (TPR) repeat protein
VPDHPSPSKPRSLIRRWRVPAHYLLGTERFEGSAMLEELPGALGTLLWQCERDVRLWATSTQVEREQLFAPTAGERCLAMVATLEMDAGEVFAPLEAIAAMLRHPVDADPQAVMLACQRISQWAEGRDCRAAALAFAQAAASVQTGSAYSAVRVALLARRAGDFGRAEGWLNRAIVLARQSGDWTTYAQAYSGLGKVNLLRGNLPSAERCLGKALRIARTHGLALQQAMAHHDLFVVLAEEERHTEALAHAAEAFSLYPAEHADRLSLAHDVAASWVEQGQYAAALPVLEAVVSHMEAPARALGYANAARAAGALGLRGRFEAFWHLCIDTLERVGTHSVIPGTLLNLARGAALLQDLGEAEATARRAVRLAERLHLNKTSFECEAFLNSLHAVELAGSNEEERAATPEEVITLSAHLSRTLASRQVSSV